MISLLFTPSSTLDELYHVYSRAIILKAKRILRYLFKIFLSLRKSLNLVNGCKIFSTTFRVTMVHHAELWV